MKSPMKGILQRSDYGNIKLYRVECECASEEHAHEVVVESDSDNVSITIYANTYPPFKRGFWNNFSYRIRGAFGLLFFGIIKVETTLLLGEEAATNYAVTIIKAAEEVKEYK